MLEVDVVRGVTVVTVPTEVDITNAAGLRAALLQAAAEGSPALVVDMTRTRFCDSAGLRVHRPGDTHFASLDEAVAHATESAG